jgi:site-specific recombinase XerD
MAARNRALLWIFFETGMRASELRGLRLGDVDRDRRSLRIGEQGHERWLTLSSDGWYQVRSYLEQYRLKAGGRGKEHDEDEPLFLSETYQPLTNNALTLVFHRLSKRAGITQRITPSLLRDTFAIHYLQAGGEPATLRDLLGLKDRAALNRYERFLTQSMETQRQKEPTEEYVSRSITAPHQRKRRRRRASSTVPRTHQ